MRRYQYVQQHNRKPEPVENPVFFIKSQIHVGVKLRCFGRLDPDSTWRVISIKHGAGDGLATRFASVSVPSVVGTSDDVYLKRVGGKPETRVLRFISLATSAAWWIAD